MKKVGANDFNIYITMHVITGMCLFDYHRHTPLIHKWCFSFQRPIAGRVNFCPISIADKEDDDEFLMTVAIHEVLHALVSRLWLECCNWSTLVMCKVQIGTIHPLFCTNLRFKLYRDPQIAWKFILETRPSELLKI